jgi:DNA-binding protein H-NS
MSGNLWTYLGALLIMGGLCMVYSWKLEADRAAELERKVELLEERIHADDAVMAQRDKARKEAEQKAREQRDEIQKAFEGLDDDELLCRLHGLCSKSANSRNTDAATGKPASGMPATSKTGGHD